MKIRAADIQEGMVVSHSGVFWPVLAVEHKHEFTTCITPEGGRVSFRTSDLITISQ